MRKIIRKQIRHERDGVRLAADLDAVIAINVGRGAKTTRNVVQSIHRVQQGSAGRRDQPDAPLEAQPGPPSKENP